MRRAARRAAIEEEGTFDAQIFDLFVCVAAASLVAALTARVLAENPNLDFGAFVAGQLNSHSEQLFGFTHPLAESALGPYDGADIPAIQLADGLQATLVSSSVASAADQIALWPNDDNPTHLFVCDEETSNPAVQRVDLSLPPGSNATTIVTGLTSCDPVRRTPWGTILVAEEATVSGNSGVATGGVYEILDPVHITTAINVTNRTTGANSDPLHLAKRQAVGTLSFESFAIKADGTMIYGDELAPGRSR